MKTFALIAVLCLVATSFAVQEDDVLAKIRKMENSKYGKTLLDTVQLQLQSEGPVEDLIRLLQETEAELQAEQRTDDEFINGLQDQCDADLARLVDEIQAAKNRIQQLTDELNEKIPIRDEKIRTRDEKTEFRSLINDRISELDANKILRDSEWAEELAQHDAAQYVIERAKQIIVQALKSNNFLQKTSHEVLAQVSQHFNKNSKTQFKRKSWNHIFSLLSQITASAPVQADSGLVQRVIDLCDKLIGKISESREIERRDYQHWVEEYQTTRNTLSDKVEVLTAEINQLDTDIDTLTKRINAATAERHDSEVRRDQKQTEHDERLTYCEQENDNYSHRRQSRHDEQEVVSDAVALLQSNLRLFRQYINDRLKSVTKAK